MNAAAFFRKSERPVEAGGEAVVQSGKLYVLTASGVIAKPRMAIREVEAQRDAVFEAALHKVASQSESILPSFYVDDVEYILYAKNGIISQYPMRSRELLLVFWDLHNAIKALHDNGIAHLDIKPSNIVLRDNGLPALIDFGCSGFIGDNTVANTSAGNTTLLFAPPEYFDDQQRYRRRAHDIWSFALTMLQLAAPKSFSEFQEKIPIDFLKQADYLQRNYSPQNLSILLSPMLKELHEKNDTLAKLIEPLLCYDPILREQNFKKLQAKPLEKIATVYPMPKHEEASMRKFIKETNERIKHIKHQQESCAKGSAEYQRHEYQITVCRDQREQTYLALGKIKSGIINPSKGSIPWNHTKETKEIDKLVSRFVAANGDNKIRIAFKIIRAADTWLYEHQNTKHHKAAVQHLLSGFVHYINENNTPLRREAFSAAMQPRLG
jgi:serine/threonine protein kinase